MNEQIISSRKYNNSNELVKILTSFVREPFFEVTFSVLKDDLPTLGRTCVALSKMEIVKTYLSDRHASYLMDCQASYVLRQLELFNLIKASAPHSVMAEKYHELGCDLRKLLEYGDFVYLIEFINELSLLLDRDNFVIDNIVIDFLKVIEQVAIDEEFRKHFLKQLIWINYSAILSALQGFDLLKDFTIKVLHTLTKKECRFFNYESEELRARVTRFDSAILDEISFFSEYETELDALRQVAYKKKSHMQNCIVS